MPSGASPARTRGLEGLVGLVPRGTLTGDPRSTRAADGSASGVCIVPTARHEVGRATSPDWKIWRRVFQTDFGQRLPCVSRSDPRAPAPSSVMGGSKQHDAMAPAPLRVAASPSRAHGLPAPRASLAVREAAIFGRKIGEGTQGEVRARHATTGKRYVVKILDLDDPDDPDDPSTVSSRAVANDAKRQVSSLTDEEARRSRRSRLPRMLSHPNVVRCHGTFR